MTNPRDCRSPHWISPLSRGQPQRLIAPRHLTPLQRPEQTRDLFDSDREKRDTRQFLVRAAIGLAVAFVFGAVLCEVVR